MNASTLDVYLQDEGMIGKDREDFLSLENAFSQFDLTELSLMAQIIDGFSLKNLHNYCAASLLINNKPIPSVKVFKKFVDYLCENGVLRNDDGNYFVMRQVF